MKYRSIDGSRFLKRFTYRGRDHQIRKITFHYLCNAIKQTCATAQEQNSII